MAIYIFHNQFQYIYPDCWVKITNVLIDHYLPFSDTNIVLLFWELIMTCKVSKYLICMADWEFNIYDVYFNNFADSTSALAEIMLAYDTLFWIAADCMFRLVSSESIRSLIKIFSMNNPQVPTLCST